MSIHFDQVILNATWDIEVAKWLKYRFWIFFNVLAHQINIIQDIFLIYGHIWLSIRVWTSIKCEEFILKENWYIEVAKWYIFIIFYVSASNCTCSCYTLSLYLCMCIYVCMCVFTSPDLWGQVRFFSPSLWGHTRLVGTLNSPHKSGMLKAFIMRSNAIKTCSPILTLQKCVSRKSVYSSYTAQYNHAT